MSYDINWHRRKETIYNEKDNPKPEPCVDDNYYRLPFTYERGEDTQEGHLNITSNLREMFSWAYGCEYWVDEVERQTGEVVSKKTHDAVGKMIQYPEEAKKYNSPNGWGTYPYALQFLRNLETQAMRYKDAYLEVNR